jgi:hypothetical protein
MADSPSSSELDNSFISSIHDHLCLVCSGDLAFSSSSSSSSSTLVSWEDTTLSSIPLVRAADESEIEISPSTSVPNELSASGDSSKSGTSTRLEPYVLVARFFVVAMGGDEGGGEEVGGAVLGELFEADIGSASSLSARRTLWNALDEASSGPSIVDGYSRLSRFRDKIHVIAFKSLLARSFYW